MSRKNIFELINETYDLKSELERIKRLFVNEKIVEYAYERYCSVLDAVRLVGFSTWKNRGRCVDADEFLSALEYDNNLWRKAPYENDELFKLIEIVYNFWYIAFNYRYATTTFSENGERKKRFFLLKENLDECLSQYNYKGEYFPDLEQLIVVEDKPEATAVAEIVDKEVSRKVLRYNHFTLKGDLKAKKEILVALGSELESKRKQLHGIDSSLESDIFYMLNNMDLRHNNRAHESKYYKKAVEEMDEGALENWYDELYQMILLAYLRMEQEDRAVKVKELKKIVPGT